MSASRVIAGVLANRRRREVVQAVKRRSAGLSREQLVAELERDFASAKLTAPGAGYFELTADTIIGGRTWLASKLVGDVGALVELLKESSIPRDLAPPHGVHVGQPVELDWVESVEDNQQAIASAYERLGREGDPDDGVIAFGWLRPGAGAGEPIEVMIGKYRVGELSSHARRALAGVLHTAAGKREPVVVQLEVFREADEYHVGVNIP